MYVLLVIGIVLVIFGGLVLVKFPDKPGARIHWRGVEIRSTSAGLPLIVLGLMTMALMAIWSNERSPEVEPTPSSITALPPAPIREGVLIGRSENHVAVAIAFKSDHAVDYCATVTRPRLGLKAP
jgi:hypothetical protein